MVVNYACLSKPYVCCTSNEASSSPERVNVLEPVDKWDSKDEKVRSATVGNFDFVLIK
jgi:hypothetical protein